MLSCEFDRHGCRHESLFLTEYKRTNRTKGTKILRCFPHCCPGHVNRSYCGAAVHVRVQAHAPQFASHKRTREAADGTSGSPLDELLVFAHFEEVGARSFAVGDELSAHAVFQSIQSEQHPKGEWIQGHPTDALDRSTQVFQINPGARWYYEWESAATKAQRFTKHVLKVYVLRASHTVSSSLRIVATATSSQFMVVSYRRAAGEITGDRRILALLAENVARQSGELGVEPDNLIASLGQRMLPLLVESSAQPNSKEDKQGAASPTSSWSPQPTATMAPEKAEPIGPRRARRQGPLINDAAIELKLVWAASHPREARMAKRLAVLATFLSAAAAVDFQQVLVAFTIPYTSRSVETEAEQSATPPPFGGEHIDWRKILSPLRRHSPDNRSLPSLRDAGITATVAAGGSEVAILVGRCVEAIAVVVLDDSNRHTLSQLLREGSHALLQPASLRSSYLQCVSTLYEHLDRFFSSRFDVSFEQLHEDMVAALFRVEAFRHVRSQLLDQLSSTSMAGWKCFVSMARQGFVVTTSDSSHHKRRRFNELPRSRYPVVSIFNGSWHFDGRQCSIQQLSATTSELSLSVAGAIEWMRELASVSVSLDENHASMTLRSEWALLPRGTTLVLDGKKRIFDAFPSGVASTVPWLTLAWGDYRAQLVNADCLMLEFSAWPAWHADDDQDKSRTVSSRESTALRVKLCLRPLATHTSRRYVLSVDGVVEHALCRPDSSLVTMPIDRRRHAVNAWTPVYQLKAVYTPLEKASNAR